MKHLRLITIALSALLVLGACGDKDAADGLSGSEGSNELLAYVPSDTPYVIANLEPVPDAVIDAYLLRLQPVLDMLQAELTEARQSLASSPSGADDPARRLAQAVLTELDGKMSRTGLESLGFDLASKRVVYGMGAFPVFRIGLSDAQTLRDTIARVMNNAQVTAPQLDFQGVPYWRVTEDGSGGAAGFYVTVFDDHLAFGILPTSAEAELLPKFLGLDLPAGNDAEARLKALNRQQAYTNYGTGILDVRKLADEFMSPDTLTGRTLAASGAFDPADLAPECVAEVHRIIENAPRLTVGVKALDENEIATQYRVETPPTLAGQLLGLVSRMPAADPAAMGVMELAFGMRFGAVRDFLREKAEQIVASPYQCAQLLDLNDSAAQALEQLNQPIPPFLNNFRGVRVSLSEITMDPDSIPRNARGFMAVHVEQPQMFVGMAQMFLPDLSTLTIAPGEPPVRIPANLIPFPDLVAFAAMSDEAIGLSLGEGEEGGLPAFLDRENGPEGTFLSANYDMAAYLEYSQMMNGANPAAGEDGFDYYPGALAKAANQALEQMADRSITSMSFTPGGLEIDNRMTFK
jgi:hypothetical protein